MNPKKESYTLIEFAEKYELKLSTVRKWVNTNNRFETFLFGGRRRIMKDKAEKFLKGE